MLAIFNRYKAVFILLSLIILALLIWMLVIGSDRDKTPSRGVFVVIRLLPPVHSILSS